MGKISDLDANSLLDVMFGRIANPFPASYYMAVSTTEPDNTGGTVTEPVGASYARVLFANNATTFPGAAARETAIGVEIAFAMAEEDWGLLTHFAVYDHLTLALEANFKGWGLLGTPLNITAGGTVTFVPGSLIISSPGF